jgi:hypothetical protein
MSTDTSVTGSAKNAAATAASIKDDYIKKLEAQGDEWDAQLSLWSAKASKASAHLQADFHQWQRDFQGKRGEAKKALDTLRNSSQHALEEMKGSAEKAWGEVKTAFESAKKKFE